MFSIQQPLLVFSDLDGTLLDSHSYDWQPAAPWLSRLREANVPVILCSSKTSAEMLYLQKTLCNFAFFSGLIDAQFWAGSAQPKSPELTANYC